MRPGDVERALQVAISCQDHDAYAAAARIGWPDALFDCKELMGRLEDADAEILRRERLLQVADLLELAVHAYVVQYVKQGPEYTDEEASAMINALRRYRELRGHE